MKKNISIILWFSFCLVGIVSIKIVLAVDSLSDLALGNSISQENPHNNLSLPECFQLALKQSEALAIQQQKILEAEGRFKKALSGILPDISFVFNEKWQDKQVNASKRLSDYRLTLSQPIFTGFKEQSAITAARFQKEQQQFQQQRVQELIFIDVKDAFYLFLDLQNDVQTLEKTREAFMQRVEELEKREALGRSRLSEVANARLRLSRSEAGLEKAHGDLAVARQFLEFLTGQAINAVRDQEIDEKILTQTKQSLFDIEDRPDVKAAQANFKAAQKNVSVAQSSGYPAVALNGNSYTKRSGSSANVDWDVLLSVDVPVFKGGETAGAIKETKAFARQQELQWQETKRRAKLAIDNALTQFETAMRQQDAFKKAFEAAENNYELQLKDYENNLVNNLDVLQAVTDLEETRREYLNATVTLNSVYWDFIVAIGKLNDVI